MKRNIFLMTGIAIMILTGCNSKQIAGKQPVAVGRDVRNNLDWAGTYTGMIPCADCGGIATRVTLNRDGSYGMLQKYEGHEEVYEEKGKFGWNGNTVTFENASNGTTVRFNVSEGKITMLDRKGKEITGNLANDYILAKVNPDLVGKKWKLVELAGKKVEESQSAFILLDAASNSVSGNLGCNNFAGSYELKTLNRIKFSLLVITQKMCLNMDMENELKRALEMADNYNLSENRLVLNRARMAPLAVFTP